MKTADKFPSAQLRYEPNLLGLSRNIQKIQRTSFTQRILLR